MRIQFLFAAILCSTFLFAQQKGEVSGTVLDAELQNEPLLFANISLKGTEFKTRTNFFGNFEITDIAPGNHILRIDFAGYETREIPITILAGNRIIVETEIHALSLKMDEMSHLNLSSDSKEETLTKSFRTATPKK